MFAAIDDLAMVVHLAQPPSSVAAMIRMFSTRWPCLVLMLKPYRITKSLPFRSVWPVVFGPSPSRIKALGLGAAMIGQIKHANSVPASPYLR